MLYIQMEFCPRTLKHVLAQGAIEDEDAWQVSVHTSGASAVEPPLPGDHIKVREPSLQTAGLPAPVV